MMYTRMKVALLWLVLVGCAKDTSEPPPRAAARGSPAPARSAAMPRSVAFPRVPVKTTPRELFADFTRPEADGVALAVKYRDGATFTATIKTVGHEEDGTPVVWIDVDGENLMTLGFANPAPTDLRAGAQLTVTCRLGSASGALMMVTSCTSS
jgi:hypothetical protein